jgi:hypothetical protein
MPQKLEVVLMRMLFPRDHGAQKARNRHHPHERLRKCGDPVRRLISFACQQAFRDFDDVPIF